MLVLASPQVRRRASELRRCHRNQPPSLLIHSRFLVATGVMTAASFWSLLAPAIEMAEDPESYGALAFVPVAIGFVVGAAFVMAAG